MCLYQTDQALSIINPAEVYSEDNVWPCALGGILVWRWEKGQVWELKTLIQTNRPEKTIHNFGEGT